MRNFFGDIKDKILRANDVEGDDYYNDDDYYYDDEDTYDDDDSKVTSESAYSPSSDYDFGYPSESENTYVNKFSEPKNQTTSSASVSNSSKFTKKQGTNIYQMNSAPSEVRVNRVVYFVIEDAEDARNIADCMIKKDTVVLADISRLSVEDANRVLNFLDGVRYICKSSIEEIGNIHLIVPDSIELTGDFFAQVSGGAFFG